MNGMRTSGGNHSHWLSQPGTSNRRPADRQRGDGADQAAAEHQSAERVPGHPTEHEDRQWSVREGQCDGHPDRSRAVTLPAGQHAAQRERDQRQRPLPAASEAGVGLAAQSVRRAGCCGAARAMTTDRDRSPLTGVRRRPREPAGAASRRGSAWCWDPSARTPRRAARSPRPACPFGCGVVGDHRVPARSGRAPVDGPSIACRYPRARATRSNSTCSSTTSAGGSGSSGATAGCSTSSRLSRRPVASKNSQAGWRSSGSTNSPGSRLGQRAARESPPLVLVPRPVDEYVDEDVTFG